MPRSNSFSFSFPSSLSTHHTQPHTHTTGRTNLILSTNMAPKPTKHDLIHKHVLGDGIYREEKVKPLEEYLLQQVCVYCVCVCVPLLVSPPPHGIIIIILIYNTSEQSSHALLPLVAVEWGWGVNVSITNNSILSHCVCGGDAWYLHDSSHTHSHTGVNIWSGTDSYTNTSLSLI